MSVNLFLQLQRSCNAGQCRYITERVVLSKEEKLTASGGQSDKQKPTPVTSVQSVKSLGHPQHDSNTFSFLSTNIFTVMFGS